MRLMNGLLLPWLLSCVNGLTAVSGKPKIANYEAAQEKVSIRPALGNRANDYMEKLPDDPIVYPSLANFPCPEEDAILPCICSVDSGTNRTYLDCTNVGSEEELESVFQQDFPVKDLYQFSMANNSAVLMFNNFMNGVTFESLYLSPGPFALEMISDDFLMELKDTLQEIEIQNSKLTTELFPFLILPVMNQLRTLKILKSDINFIPEIHMNSLSDFTVAYSSVENLINGTISLGAGPMSVSFMNNHISNIEPGSIFFADEDSADSSKFLDIYLTYNRLRSLQAGTFRLRNGHSYLHLYSNLITSIEPGTFVVPVGNASSSRDLYIDLAPNHLQSLQAGTFPLTNGAVTLNLYSNQITSIDPGTFVLPETTDFLEIGLDLDHNQLTTVDEAVFGPLMPFMTYLELSDNPLTCGCDIVWLVLNTQYINLVSGECADGTRLQDLNPQDFVDICRT